ncbi:MAG: hypothetical protein ACRBBR_00710 [Cellvibrionaceae bacterium]
MSLTVDEMKALVIRRGIAKRERDALIADVDVSGMTGGNPMALMGLVSKMEDFKKAYALTKEVESISDDICREVIAEIGR